MSRAEKNVDSSFIPIDEIHTLVIVVDQAPEEPKQDVTVDIEEKKKKKVKFHSLHCGVGKRIICKILIQFIQASWKNTRIENYSNFKITRVILNSGVFITKLDYLPCPY